LSSLPKWHSLRSFYFASLSVAFGLGNFWRMPYVVAENGGGAYLFIYLIFSFAIGLPLLILELSYGRFTASNLFKGNQFKWINWILIGLAVFTLSYYSIVAGWVFHFSIQFLREVLLFYFKDTVTITEYSALIQNPILQISLSAAHLAILMLISTKKIDKGIEKYFLYLFPFIIGTILILLSIILIKSPVSSDLLKYLFYPDFTELKATTWLSALGHVFFSMGIGFGVMITYGSYLDDSVQLPVVGFKTALGIVVLSLLSLVTVFGVSMQVGQEGLSHPSLFFTALQKYFSYEDGSGVFLGFLFFLVFYLVSLLGSLGLFEVIISFVSLRLKWGRIRSSLTTGWSLFILLSFLIFINAQFSSLQESLLLIIDKILIEWVLPVVGGAISVYILLNTPEYFFKSVFYQGEKVESISIFKEWLWIVKWLIPFLIILFILLPLIF